MALLAAGISASSVGCSVHWVLNHVLAQCKNHEARRWDTASSDGIRLNWWPALLHKWC